MAALRIAAPCAADWDAMRRVDGGRECSSCSLRVHDLSRMTQPQALAVALVFGGGDRRVCGRLRVDQHGDAVFREGPSRLVTTRGTVLAAAVTLGTGCSSTADLPASAAVPEACVPVATISLQPVARPADDAEPRLPVAPVRATDMDQDGLDDQSDVCPADPGPADTHGCPKRVIITTAGDIAILQRVTFRAGSAQIGNQNAPILDATAEVIRAHPELTHVVIEGHADVAEKNPQKVSLARAKAVVDYLTKKGVDPALLEARGAGSQKPLDSNATEDGRARNRRVDFSIQN